jgi:putative flippase GtrA
MSGMSNDHWQSVRFIAVGTAAAAVHWGVVRLAVDNLGLAPLVVNGLGWMVAFVVSFRGHRYWTFADTSGRDTAHSLWRFGLVSLGGFVLNQVSYAAVLRTGAVRYDLALGLVLVGLAVVTFVVSRWWAFRPADPRPVAAARCRADAP